MFKILDTHTAVEVVNLEQSEEYFSKVLGMERFREFQKPEVGRIVWFPGLELRQTGKDGAPGTVLHVAWQVDDIDEAVRALRENGVTFESDEPRRIDAGSLDTDEIVRFIFFETPTGLQGELYQVDLPGE